MPAVFGLILLHPEKATWFCGDLPRHKPERVSHLHRRAGLPGDRRHIVNALEQHVSVSAYGGARLDLRRLQAAPVQLIGAACRKVSLAKLKSKMTQPKVRFMLVKK